MITEAEFRALAAPGLQPHPARRSRRSPTSTRRCRSTSSSPTSATRSCSSRWSAASASAAIRSSACRRRCASRVRGTHVEVERSRRRRRDASTAIRSRSSRRTCSASAPRRGRACRASAAASPATSATTRCATSSRGSRPRADRPSRPRDVPDMLLLLTDELAVVDNLSGKHLPHRVRRSRRGRTRTRRAHDRLQELRAQAAQARRRFRSRPRRAVTQPRSQHRRATRYHAAVRRAKEYIAAGDIMQVRALAAHRACRSPHSPLSLYRALRSINPSPYMFYYDFGDFHVVGASPEILVRKEGDTVTLRPIAGTRPRGATREADERARRRARAPIRRSSPST